MKQLFQKLQTTNYKLKANTGFTLRKNGQTGFTLRKNGQTGFTLRKYGQTGFTMVEMLIYMGILTIVVVLFTDVLTSITDSQLHSQNASNVADDGRYIYSRIIYDITRADSVTQPLLEGDTSSTLRILIGGQEYSYAINNGNLVLTTPSGSANLNGYGTTISNLTFTKIGVVDEKSTVKIGFTVTGLISERGINDIQNFNTTIGLR